MCPGKPKTSSTAKSVPSQSQLLQIQGISSYMDELRTFIDRIPSGTRLREWPETEQKEEVERAEVRERHRNKVEKHADAPHPAVARKLTGSYRHPPYY